MSARLAAERAEDADLERLEAHLERMREAGGDVTAFIDADIAFHLETATALRLTPRAALRAEPPDRPISKRGGRAM